jgi:precorrin-6B methylase 2
VEASATAGSVTVVVPRGDYRIDAGAGTGSVNLEGIADTPSSGRVIIASASAGDVTIRGR